MSLITGLEERRVVTCFLEADGEILLLRRSEQVASYQGRWAGVSGYIEATADEQALIEVGEETALFGEDIRLIKRGQPLTVEDEKLGMSWVVHPYLFHVKNRDEIKIDWEHKEIRWIKPPQIDDYETMPKLKETLAQVISW